MSESDRSVEAAIDGMSEATVVVSRTLPVDVQQRQVYVELDGERIATLLYGESITRSIAAGPHRLRFDNTLHKKTVEFTAAAGERVEYRLANSAGRFALPFLAVMGVAPLYLKIERA
jgi:hypothetical protein